MSVGGSESYRNASGILSRALEITSLTEFETHRDEASGRGNASLQRPSRIVESTVTGIAKDNGMKVRKADIRVP